MAKHHASSGQSLVEFSLVLPAVFFMVLLMMQFFYIARTKIVLGFIADRMARAAAAQGSPRVVELREDALHFRVGPSWGVPTPASLSVEPLPGWKPAMEFPVIHPMDNPGRLAIVDLSFVVWPKSLFSHFLYIPRLGAHVELPMEPEVPQL